MTQTEGVQNARPEWYGQASIWEGVRMPWLTPMNGDTRIAELDAAERSALSASRARAAAARAGAFADPTRVRILHVIGAVNEIAVADICRITDVEQSVVSHHLGRLRRLGFVRVRPADRTRLYSISAEGRWLLEAILPPS